MIMAGSLEFHLPGFELGIFKHSTAQVRNQSTTSITVEQNKMIIMYEKRTINLTITIVCACFSSPLTVLAFVEGRQVVAGL